MALQTASKKEKHRIVRKRVETVVALIYIVYTRGEVKERTMIFWVGLILASLAGLELFGIAWLIMVVSYWEDLTVIEFWIRSPIIPAIVAGVVFMIIGIVMMRSGRKGH